MSKETWREVILKGPGPQTKKEAVILYAKGLIMLGALPMVRAEHTEHEPVKPHVKNKKAS